MKRGMVVVFLLLPVLMSPGVSAQENVLGTNPLGFLVGTYSVSWERVLGETTSLLGTFEYMDWKQEGFKSRGFGGFFSFLIYAEHAPQGLFYGPSLGWFQLSIDGYDALFQEQIHYDGPVLAGGGLAGYQWFTQNQLAVTLFGGLHVFYYVKRDTSHHDGALLSVPQPYLGFRLGRRF